MSIYQKQFQLAPHYDLLKLHKQVEKYQRWYKFNVKCKCGFEKFVLANTLRGGKSTCCITCANEKHYKGLGNISSTFFSRILEGARVRNIDVSITIEYILRLLVLMALVNLII